MLNVNVYLHLNVIVIKLSQLSNAINCWGLLSLQSTAEVSYLSKNVIRLLSWKFPCFNQNGLKPCLHYKVYDIASVLVARSDDSCIVTLSRNSRSLISLACSIEISLNYAVRVSLMFAESDELSTISNNSSTWMFSRSPSLLFTISFTCTSEHYRLLQLVELITIINNLRISRTHSAGHVHQQLVLSLR